MSAPLPTLNIPQEPWLVRHGKTVLVGVAAAGAAFLLVVAVVTNLQKARARAWEQLSFAQAQSAQGKKDEALSTLETLLRSQRTGPVAVQSLMFRAELLLEKEDKPGALQAAEEALRQADRPEYKALALAGLAYVAEEAGDRAKAIAHYQSFIKDFPDHFLTGRAYAQLGRLQSAEGAWADAQGTLEKLITLYPASVWAEDAKADLEEIKKRLPVPSVEK